jgi:hypothetical protein
MPLRIALRCLGSNAWFVCVAVLNVFAVMQIWCLPLLCFRDGGWSQTPGGGLGRPGLSGLLRSPFLVVRISNHTSIAHVICTIINVFWLGYRRSVYFALM